MVYPALATAVGGHFPSEPQTIPGGQHIPMSLLQTLHKGLSKSARELLRCK